MPLACFAVMVGAAEGDAANYYGDDYSLYGTYYNIDYLNTYDSCEISGLSLVPGGGPYIALAAAQKLTSTGTVETGFTAGTLGGSSFSGIYALTYPNTAPYPITFYPLVSNPSSGFHSFGLAVHSNNFGLVDVYVDGTEEAVNLSTGSSGVGTTMLVNLFSANNPSSNGSYAFNSFGNGANCSYMQTLSQGASGYAYWPASTNSDPGAGSGPLPSGFQGSASYFVSGYPEVEFYPAGRNP